LVKPRYRTTHSRTIRRGELAEWVAIADFSKSTLGVEGVVEKLSSLDIVKKLSGSASSSQHTNLKREVLSASTE
jgi:hypothetical protein